MEDFIKDFIKDKKLNITKRYWDELKNKYDKDTIKDCMIKHIINGDIDFPYQDISYDEAFEDFQDLCAKEPLQLISGETYTKAKYKSKISSLYLDLNNTGNKASNYFQQKNRMKASGAGFKSPDEIWKSEKHLKSVLNPIWTLKMDKVDTNSLLSGIALRAYVASQFKPIIAKSIYSMYNARKVLDTSSGWGDRLCGFFSTKDTENYLGVDPNTSLHPQYLKQIEMYKKIYPNKNAKILCDGAENIKFKDYGTFDFVFTSPPYFNAEHYSNDEKQSFLQYKSDNDWLNNFLFVWLKNAWEALEDDGHIIVNISDIYSKKGERVEICDTMVDFVKNELHGYYVGCFGMRLALRPNMKSVENVKSDNAIFYEPCWVFSKRNPENVTDKFDPDYQIYHDEVNRFSIFDMF